MDWLRRNWPDLIIGVALVAVVALIVVTLLSGGSLASLVRRDNPPELSVTDTTPDTAVGSAASVAGSSDPQTADNATSGTAGNAGTNSADGGVDVFVPGIPGGQAGVAASTSGGQAQASTTPGTEGAASGGIAQSGVQGNQADAAPSGPLPEAAQNGGFRVAAGAVDSRDAAASLAESFREADYTVTVEQQGNLYLLWVGPYATRAGADRVAARLQTDGLVPDALVYTYSGPDSANANTGPDSSSGGNVAAAGDAAAATTADTASGTATTPSENTGAASTGNAANAVATAPTGNAATAGTTGPRYLQVGAFTSDERAQPLRDQLGALGFTVTRRQSDTGLVRLLVGPFGDAQLVQTQARLQDAGIPDAFPVTP